MTGAIPTWVLMPLSSWAPGGEPLDPIERALVVFYLERWREGLIDVPHDLLGLVLWVRLLAHPRTSERSVRRAVARLVKRQLLVAVTGWALRHRLCDLVVEDFVGWLAELESEGVERRTAVSE